MRKKNLKWSQPDSEEIVAHTEEVAQPNTSLVNTIVPTGVFVIMHAEEDMTLVVSVANSAQSIQRAQEHFNTDSMFIFTSIYPYFTDSSMFVREYVSSSTPYGTRIFYR